MQYLLTRVFLIQNVDVFITRHVALLDLAPPSGGDVAAVSRNRALLGEPSRDPYDGYTSAATRLKPNGVVASKRTASRKADMRSKDKIYAEQSTNLIPRGR